jgi:hypothetical protein
VTQRVMRSVICQMLEAITMPVVLSDDENGAEDD